MNPIIMPPPAEDQAAALRDMVSEKKDPQPARIKGMRSVAILSGKGGVGKSNLAVNLALALAEQDYRVVLLDADLGLANIDVLFGVIPKFNLSHVMRGEKELPDILFKVGERISIIPGGAGLRELADLDEANQSWIIDRMSVLGDNADVLILDTGAGMHKNVLAFSMASDKTILVTTTEPTAIKDAYSVLKSLFYASRGEVDIGLVVNMASDERDAQIAASRICDASRQFLDFDIPYLGCILWDQAVREAVMKRRPLLLEPGDSSASAHFRRLTRRIFEPTLPPLEERESDGFKQFLVRLAKQMTKKGTR